jgi:hypothetical protein
MLLTQALMGERVTIYDRNGEGFAWGQLNSDGYVGWLPDRALAKPAAAPTHKITVLRTFAFPGPSIKLPPADTLVMGAAIAVIRDDGVFAVTRGGWYLPRQHVGPIGRHVDDFVAVAEQFAGTPYLWGGKSSLGIDCSGLVQVALNAAGIGCPRDSECSRRPRQGVGCGGIEEIAARRPDFLKAMSRVRRRHRRARQRASHGHDNRKHRRGDRAYQGRWQRTHRDQAARLIRLD